MENKIYPIPQSVMSIHAHPDDQDFTVAGTLAVWAQAGARVISVIVTDGAAGSNDPAQDASYKPVLAALRQEEQRAANAELGIAETVFLGYPDGELQPTLALRKDLTRLIRRYRPDVVICTDPTVRFYGNDYINHPDHRAAAEATCDAVFPSAGTRLVFADLLAEGLEPHNVKRLYLYGSEKADTWVDISTTLEQKIAALKKHASQLGDWDPSEMLRQWAAERGKELGMLYAEGFRVMVLVEEKVPDERGSSD